ncbi:citrate synthase/methylcitrate synthase [Sutcliffiella sp. NC1]|uniref:citrate synthase/methylcitrate synthase n=1 Tax=Sutcliffiella sp. NC1 TaxID=3004096 RepID=UPI0022DE52C3|nr:citrate synthase/methylcitrate synthase [Sutcliffiella sp. NC1]WBL15966.1 citrate synthase/methylcitrate synthase [Sutcliffiella sp. NC1]
MFQKGLKGIVAAETKICDIDGDNGKLIYRGYEIGELTNNYSFEEVAYLLWYGEIGEKHQLQQFNKDWKKYLNLTDTTKIIIDSLPTNMDLMSVIRTTISSLGTIEFNWKPSISQAMYLTAIVPSIIAYHTRRKKGLDYIPPNDCYGHVENFLYMLNGKVPDPAHVSALETYMILTMEHGMNASTFSARVTASTESDIVSAITSAIGTMKGPLHGGAPSGVIDLLNETAKLENRVEYIRTKILNGEKLMGFGHRVYKTHDPRAMALKEKLTKFVGTDEWLDLAMEVEQICIDQLNELKPGRSLYTNVEYYAAAIMKAIDLPPEMFTPTFTASRMVGWTAHVLEQAENNTIYRPQSIYIGK